MQISLKMGTTTMMRRTRKNMMMVVLDMFPFQASLHNLKLTMVGIFFGGICDLAGDIIHCVLQKITHFWSVYKKMLTMKLYDTSISNSASASVHNSASASLTT